MTSRLHGIQELFDIEHLGDGLVDEQNFNTKPTEQVPIVVRTAAHGRRLEAAEWWFVPRGATERSKYPTFNARSETAASKPTWRASVASRRCIVPAQGYYEWRTEGKVKTPFYVTDPDMPMLAFAGLYSWWKLGGEGPWRLSATILTRRAVGRVAELHERVPLTLPSGLWGDWLDPARTGDQGLLDAVSDAATGVVERLEAVEVAPLQGDGPELIRPVHGG